MTKRTYISRFHYGQEDISELENASLKVLHIFEKTKRMLSQYVPDSLWLVAGTSPEPAEHLNQNGTSASVMFQKWVKAPGGWKFIGYETDRFHVAGQKGTNGKISADDHLVTL